MMDQSSDEDEGCSSRQACSSPEDDERPLKKARYRWQIKGKHHLKDKDKSQSGSTEDVSMDIDTGTSCSEVLNVNNEVPSVSQNTPPLPITDQGTPSTSCVQPPSEENSLCESLGDLLPDLFPRVNKAMNRSLYLLRCWQTKQIARGMLDNTMNCMMERMGLAPLDVESDNNTQQREGTQIEDEAILIAIQRYGLQCHEDEIPAPYQADESTVSTTEESVCKDVSRVVSSADTSANESQEQPNFETSVLCDVSCSEGSSSQQVPIAVVEDNNMNQPMALSQIEHDSFLDAAVAVAIQKKGLSVLTGTAESG